MSFTTYHIAFIVDLLVCFPSGIINQPVAGYCENAWYKICIQFKYNLQMSAHIEEALSSLLPAAI